MYEEERDRLNLPIMPGQEAPTIPIVCVNVSMRDADFKEVIAAYRAAGMTWIECAGKAISDSWMFYDCENLPEVLPFHGSMHIWNAPAEKVMEGRRQSHLRLHSGSVNVAPAITITPKEDGRFYIHVTQGERLLYDGFAPSTVTTMEEAEAEAIKGACL